MTLTLRSWRQSEFPANCRRMHPAGDGSTLLLPWMGFIYLHWTSRWCADLYLRCRTDGSLQWDRPKIKDWGRRGGGNSSASWFWWYSGHAQTVWMEKDIIRGLISVGDLSPEASKTSLSRAEVLQYDLSGLCSVGNTQAAKPCWC